MIDSNIYPSNILLRDYATKIVDTQLPDLKASNPDAMGERTKKINIFYHSLSNIYEFFMKQPPLKWGPHKRLAFVSYALMHLDFSHKYPYVQWQEFNDWIKSMDENSTKMEPYILSQKWKNLRETRTIGPIIDQLFNEIRPTLASGSFGSSINSTEELIKPVHKVIIDRLTETYLKNYATQIVEKRFQNLTTSSQDARVQRSKKIDTFYQGLMRIYGIFKQKYKASNIWSAKKRIALVAYALDHLELDVKKLQLKSPMNWQEFNQWIKCDWITRDRKSTMSHDTESLRNRWAKMKGEASIRPIIDPLLNEIRLSQVSRLSEESSISADVEMIDVEVVDEEQHPKKTPAHLSAVENETVSDAQEGASDLDFKSIATFITKYGFSIPDSSISIDNEKLATILNNVYKEMKKQRSKYPKINSQRLIFDFEMIILNQFYKEIHTLPSFKNYNNIRRTIRHLEGYSSMNELIKFFKNLNLEKVSPDQFINHLDELENLLSQSRIVSEKPLLDPQESNRPITNENDAILPPVTFLLRNRTMTLLPVLEKNSEGLSSTRISEIFAGFQPSNQNRIKLPELDKENPTRSTYDEQMINLFKRKASLIDTSSKRRKISDE